MAKAKIELKMNDAGIQALLNSPEIRGILETESSRIARTAGEGYASEISQGKKRLIGKAFTETKEAMQDNMENNTLLRAAGAPSWDKKG